MGLAVVRSLDAPRSLQSAQELEDFEQELVDQYALAAVGAGIGRRAREREPVGDLRVRPVRSAGPLWTASRDDADRFLAGQRSDAGPGASDGAAARRGALARFYRLPDLRYQGDIHALTGHVVEQPIDEFNRPAKADYGQGAGAAVGGRGRGAVRGVAGVGCRRPASTCPRRGTTSPRRCGGGWGCGSTRR